MEYILTLKLIWIIYILTCIHIYTVYIYGENTTIHVAMIKQNDYGPTSNVYKTRIIPVTGFKDREFVSEEVPTI